ncbi:lipoprotein [Streptomyces spororaveus]|uniref:Lipoprotein n=1 Tax=Streptomyces spororaveus TaxID=284039 RepID=A0ABQ3TBL5_9ACTN|nr:lipoprotein [Streptomyces spororaveus]
MVNTLRLRTAARTLLPLFPLGALLAGCGDTGGLVSAGSTPTASGPVHLWPDRRGASVPPADPGGAPPEYVKGIPPVRDQDVHAVDPVALVQAELRAHPDTEVGADGMPPRTAAAIQECATDQAGQAEQDPEACPVLKPYYRDLTGNGKDELIVGIEFPDKMMSVRVYTTDPGGRLNRIMATTETVISVELAGRDVILKVPSGNRGYELITAWSWDERQLTMLPTREQIVRVPGSPAPGNPAPGKSQAPGAREPAPGPGRP